MKLSLTYSRELKMKNGQGVHRLELKEKNRKRVAKWVEENPNGTMTECKNELKLAYNTISSHLKAIREEA